MNKIGIASPYRVANYGTKLQAYAISEYIKNITGKETEIINFAPSDDHRIQVILRKVFSCKRNIARIKKIVMNKKNKKNDISRKQLERVRAINKFDDMLPLGEKIKNWNELKESSKQYDCVICGSDQIWLPDNLKDRYYTLEFCDDDVKKGSYAASLGVEVLNNRQKKKYAKFLNKLDFISVRENIGRDLLKSFYNKKDVTWVCDPTLLLTKKQWSDVEERPKVLDSISGDYVFCYFLGTNEEHRQVVYKYAKEKKLKILSIANFKGICESDTKLSDFQLYNLTVNEFLYLIHHSTMVCTDSMHATIFSIIFETNFITFERFKNSDSDSRNSRIYSLLKVMKLEDRLYKGEKILEKQIDYDENIDTREKYINYSKDYIMKEIV